jgi:hypothetical protein
MKKERKDFMSDKHKTAMGNMPRTHQNCKQATGVMRPGKTAKDRANRGA